MNKCENGVGEKDEAMFDTKGSGRRQQFVMGIDSCIHFLTLFFPSNGCSSLLVLRSYLAIDAADEEDWIKLVREIEENLLPCPERSGFFRKSQK